MDKHTVLSLSSDQAALATREIALRNGGMNVVSVMSPIEARFEIEMGRCGIFLVCYRLPKSAADELTLLFRERCPQGQIVFVMQQQPGQNHVPAEADIVLPESSGPQKIIDALKERQKVSSEQRGALRQ